MSVTTPPLIDGFFERRGWSPLPYQRDVWAAIAQGKSGLVHSSTGSGKTLSVWLGYLAVAPPTPGLKALWITPLRSLAQDTVKALQEACDDLQLGWRVELRTGDTSATMRQRQLKDVPDVLVTTPESLTLLQTGADSPRLLETVDLVVIDEWHELIGSKRGVQTELALARLRTAAPNVMTWGLSATLGNTMEAADVLLPGNDERAIVRGEDMKPVVIDTLLPANIERFPWAGHIGVRMVPAVVKEIDQAESALVFCNTRAQTEIWFQAILDQNPEWRGLVALHHGSLDREVRAAVEEGLKQGLLRCVVCTSSLDLGVDFSPVERVFQIGSPKGVARLLQRAGRSGHRPGAISRVTCVPTHALELLDITAAREAAAARRIEGRRPLLRPLDVLSQHLVSSALTGFDEESLKAEVRATYAFADLTDEEWQWAMDYVTKGGPTLAAYPDYQKVVEEKGRYIIKDRKTATRHRMSIGTIVSDGSINIQYVKGGYLGSVEESFASRLKKGDVFIFSGKLLEFVRVRDMTCYVRRAPSTSKGPIPRWGGGRLPLSGELAESIRLLLGRIKDGESPGPEIVSMAPLLHLQAEWSAIPDHGELLIERVTTRDGHHLFFYPLEGRAVHEGLAALLATRLNRLTETSYSIAVNDYGIELLSPIEAPLDTALSGGHLFDTEGLTDDILASLNASEMAKRQFRETARIAGLVFSGYPGSPKSARQLQASSGLFYDVFSRYDPDHPLLGQARREVLERNLEHERLSSCLRRLAAARILVIEPPRPTPFAFPILVDRLRETVSGEKVDDRIKRLIEGLEKAAR